MPLERLMLILVVALAGAAAVGLAVAGMLMGPPGLLLLGVLAGAGYVLWRLVSERARDPEDSHYENDFDR